MQINKYIITVVNSYTCEIDFYYYRAIDSQEAAIAHDRNTNKKPGEVCAITKVEDISSFPKEFVTLCKGNWK